MQHLVALMALVSLRLAAGVTAEAALARCRTQVVATDSELTMQTVCLVTPDQQFVSWTGDDTAGFRRFDVE
jgi:hypothetical protein